jgi:uncharacterized membrane protein (DUF4010 family)
MSDPLAGAATSVLIGLLLGLERQRAHKREGEIFAGIRTFPVLTLGGYLAALTAEPLVLTTFLIAVAALAVTAYVRTADRQGATTEAVAVCAPILGVLVHGGHAIVAAASAVVITLLLTLKAPLHRLAGTVTEEEILSILKFAVVAVILLPLLPTDPIGPYDAVVPRQVGWVVVLLSGVSLGGYLLVRFLGDRSGWALAGLLGGLVSSTATTLTFSGKAREVPDLVRSLAVGTLLASTVLYLRGLFVIGVFDRDLAFHLAPRLGALFVVGGVAGYVAYRRAKGKKSSPVSLGNPVELGRALGLAFLFTAILVATRAAQEQLGTKGLWATAVLGGMLDVDSVAVSVARLRAQGLVPSEVAGRAYLLATVSNLALKAGVVAFVGRWPFARQVLPLFAILAAASVLALLV